MDENKVSSMSIKEKIFDTHYDGKCFQLYSDKTFKKFILYSEGKKVLRLNRWFGLGRLSKLFEENDAIFQLGYNRLKHANHLLVVTLFISSAPYKMALFDLDKRKKLPISNIRYDWLI